MEARRTFLASGIQIGKCLSLCKIEIRVDGGGQGTLKERLAKSTIISKRASTSFLLGAFGMLTADTELECDYS